MDLYLNDHLSICRGDRMATGKNFSYPRDRRKTCRDTCAERFSLGYAICHEHDTPCALGQLAVGVTA